MNEVQIKIAELKIEYAEQKLTDHVNLSWRGYGYSSEEAMFDCVIANIEAHGFIFSQTNIVMGLFSKTQRQRFFDRVAVVMSYDRDGMSEREFILNTKLLIYGI